MGTKPKAPTVQKWSTGPVRSAYITVAPTPDFSISAGQIGSLEGFESAIDWKNFNMMTTSLWDVENAQVSASQRPTRTDRWSAQSCSAMGSIQTFGTTCNSRHPIPLMMTTV
ncbi:MAG: outer membrane beta-barrel protein [Acetobacteraceae bacterium]